MKKTIRYGLVGALTAMLLLHCNVVSPSDDDDTDSLVLSALSIASNISILGVYNFFDGTDGTTNNGPYVVTNNFVSQTFTAFSSVTEGAIEAFDNGQQVFYYRQTSSGANQNKYIWVRWTINGSTTYLCPDLNGAADTLADSQTEFASVLAGTMSSLADPTNLGVAGTFVGQGCNGIFWSRLERQ